MDSHSKSIFNSFWKKHYDEEVPSWVEVRKVVSHIGKFAQEKILEGFELQLPLRLGSIKISCRQLDIKYNDGKINLPINWKATKEYFKEHGVKKYIYHMNVHNDKICKVKWLPNGCNWKNKSYYVFKPCRQLKRNIAKKIINENTYYSK